MRILIVEDDHFYAGRLAELLQDHQIEVVKVESTEQALGSDIQSFDGAIIDVMLPNDPAASGISMEESRGGFLAGICLARRLLEENRNLRIALLSANVTGGEAQAWAAEQSIPFIHKYDGPQAVLGTLQRLAL